MGFRAFQPLANEPIIPLSTEVESNTENGVILERSVSYKELHKKAPDPSLYDFDKNVAAGTNLEKVPTKIKG